MKFTPSTEHGDAELKEMDTPSTDGPSAASPAPATIEDSKDESAATPVKPASADEPTD